MACVAAVGLESPSTLTDSDCVPSSAMGKSKGGGGDFWSGLKGWKQVAVGDDLLLGAEDYGFCGLEELDGSALGARDCRRHRR